VIRRFAIFVGMVVVFSAVVTLVRAPQGGPSIVVGEAVVESGKARPVHEQAATREHVAAHARTAPADATLEERAEATLDLHSDVAEALGGRAGLQWSTCEGGRCAAFLQVLGVNNVDAAPVKDVTRGHGLPFTMSWSSASSAGTLVAFGDQDLARRELHEETEARWISRLMAKGLSEKAALAAYRDSLR